jgi:SAM-dependent methyltransferase
METLDRVNREGQQRLQPSLTNPSWLVLSRRRVIFQGWLARVDGRELNVLDIGGRVQPYRPLLEGRIRRYIAVDVHRSPLVNVVARGEQIPLADGQFDVVICTQVLQYLPRPDALIAEIYRVLKPGGCMLLSAPAACPTDAAEECWRFLPASLRLLLSDFSEAEVVAEGGSIVGLFRTINYCLSIFVRFRGLRTIFKWTICPLLNLWGEGMERLVGSANQQFTPNYSAWARK